MRHGDPTYPVQGETDETSGELFHVLCSTFPMIPEKRVWQVIADLRFENDAHGVALGDDG